MKKFAILTLAGFLAISACKKDDDNQDTGNVAADPIAGLVVKNTKMVLVAENTGAWCQYCPNGAEIMIQLHGVFEDLVPISIHNNDPLATPTAVNMELLFPAGGYPTIHVNGVALDNYGDAENAVTLATTEIASLGAAHKVTANDTAYRVDVKVEVFEDMNNREFFIQSFLIVDGVLAKDYGPGLDLRQTSSVPIVEKGPVGGNSYWAQDAAFVNALPSVESGDAFRHLDNVWSAGIGDTLTTAYGLPLSAVNPFFTDFVTGDVFGSKYTPITFYLMKQDLSTIQYERLRALTLIMELVYEDGNPVLKYTNSYVSDIN